MLLLIVSRTHQCVTEHMGDVAGARMTSVETFILVELMTANIKIEHRLLL
jgi:hypothetical protein